MKFDSNLQRKIMGCFATGVTIVTTRAGDVIWGMTANAITSLSLDPPLVLISVDRRNAIQEYIRDGQCFAINVLGVEHEMISSAFATPGPKDFSEFSLVVGDTGSPILADSIAYVDCRLERTLPGGDHDIFIGRAVDGSVSDGRPLIFFRGKYCELAQETFNAKIPSDSYPLDDTYNYYGSF